MWTDQSRHIFLFGTVKELSVRTQFNWNRDSWTIKVFPFWDNGIFQFPRSCSYSVIWLTVIRCLFLPTIKHCKFFLVFLWVIIIRELKGFPVLLNQKPFFSWAHLVVSQNIFEKINARISATSYSGLTSITSTFNVYYFDSHLSPAVLDGSSSLICGLKPLPPSSPQIPLITCTRQFLDLINYHLIWICIINSPNSFAQSKHDIFPL